MQCISVKAGFSLLLAFPLSCNFQEQSRQNSSSATSSKSISSNPDQQMFSLKYNFFILLTRYKSLSRVPQQQPKPCHHHLHIKEIRSSPGFTENKQINIGICKHHSISNKMISVVPDHSYQIAVLETNKTRLLA